MSITIPVRKIKLVRESNHRYDIPSKHIHGPEDAAHIINEVLDLENEAQEVFGAIYLDTKNAVLGVMELTRGSVNASIVHPREVFKGALLHNASSTIVFHNHPSGNSNPSREDIAVTHRLIKAGRILDIPVLDHIIIGNSQFLSLKEHGSFDI